MEKVITEFNKAMEESGSKMERLKSTVMKEAKAMIASLEDAEARRLQELGIRMNKLIESLTGDLEAMGQQEEEWMGSGKACLHGRRRRRWSRW